MKLAAAAVLLGFIVATLSMCGCLSAPVEGAVPTTSVQPARVVIDVALDPVSAGHIVDAARAWEAVTPGLHLDVYATGAPPDVTDLTTVYVTTAAQCPYREPAPLVAGCTVEAYTTHRVVCIDTTNTRPDEMVQVAAHEIGHALGLRHDDSGRPTIMRTLSPDATQTPTAEDGWRAAAALGL